jgi:RNA polymerase sigma factor (sigma-70 family)
MLRCKRLSRRWIEEHAEELLSQACTEYVAKFGGGERAARPVGWLVNAAWWRAQDLLVTEGRRPAASPLETAFHLADESTPTPEQQAFHRDSDERLRKALAHLPEKESRLLSLVYFGDHSVREAGQKVGWRKSAADRHHNAALEKLRALLGEDRSFHSPAGAGVLAWILGAPGAARKALAATLHRFAELGRRISALADPGSVAAVGGGGRALGACGVAAATVLCGVAASGVLPALRSAPPDRAPAAAKAASVEPITRRGLEAAPPPRSQAARPAAPPRNARDEESRTAALKAVGRTKREQRSAEHAPAPAASTAQTVNEFGVEADSAPARPATGTPESSVSSASSPASAAARPGPSAGAGSSPRSSSASPEFGL